MTRKNSQFVIVLLTGFEPLDLESDALPTEPPRHDRDRGIESWGGGLVGCVYGCFSAETYEGSFVIDVPTSKLRASFVTRLRLEQTMRRL